MTQFRPGDEVFLAADPDKAPILCTVEAVLPDTISVVAEGSEVVYSVPHESLTLAAKWPVLM